MLMFITIAVTNKNGGRNLITGLPNVAWFRRLSAMTGAKKPLNHVTAS